MILFRLRLAYLAILVQLLNGAKGFALEPGRFYADGDPAKKSVAFTFDDGPGEFTLRVLDILDQNQVKATFFMNGDQVQMRPKIAQEVAKRGHEIGDHTYSHINFYAYTKKNGEDGAKAKIRDEIRKSKDLIERNTGATLHICRMPNGFSKPWMKEIAKEFGYTLVNWTFGEDWLNVPEDKMLEEYSRNVKPGAILLFHDGGRKREKTLALLPKLIQKAREKNLQIVTVSQILPEK